MSAAPREHRSRDADRTREAVLAAAEALFAKRGYEGVSLNDVAAGAGVSRATPSYFFGSKHELYRAVLARVFVPPQALVERLASLGEAAEPHELMRAAVSEYVDYLAARPAFARLVAWEALRDGGLLLELPEHVQSIRAGRELVAAELAHGSFRAVDPSQLLISIVALCFFPVAFRPFLAILGLEPDDPSFVEERKRHVVDLVLHGIAR